MLCKEGLTSFELHESDLINSLHKFLIQSMNMLEDENLMLERIHLFCSEVLDNPKVVHQLIE